MPLIINSLGGGYTHVNTHANTHKHTDTDVSIKTILRNQASLQPACARCNKQRSSQPLSLNNFTHCKV